MIEIQRYSYIAIVNMLLNFKSSIYISYVIIDKHIKQNIIKGEYS